MLLSEAGPLTRVSINTLASKYWPTLAIDFHFGYYF